jgi:RNase P subunit RPR2
MNANDISIKKDRLKRKYKEYLLGLPLHEDPLWDEAMVMRKAAEWLEIIERQVRNGEARKKEYTALRILYLQAIIQPLHPNRQKSYCHHCTKPLEKNEGMVYELEWGKITVCIRCDPQYHHCPICDYPWIDGRCTGCSLPGT